MKTPLIAATTLILALGCPPLMAQPPPSPKCDMCEMMKKRAAMNRQRDEQIAELDKLVAAMNGSLGSQKIEAMAAVVTRLVELYKSQPKLKPPAPPAPTAPTAPTAEPPEEESHAH